MSLFDKFPVQRQDVKTWLKRKAYHIVFISSLATLTVLVAWWAIFLGRSVSEAHELKMEKLLMSIDYYAFTLGHSKDSPPREGVLKDDPGLEIVKIADACTGTSARLGPYWQDLAVQLNPAYLQDMRDELRRRRFMIVGETGFLMLLILVSGFGIYHMGRLERRTTNELHKLWSQVSHEIKTPITGIKAFLETLQTQDLTREELGPLIGMALKQVERQEQLAENMLIGQKLEKGGVGIKLKHIVLRDFIHNYFENHSVHLSLGHVQLAVDTRDDILVKGDNEALRVIFDNITDNAVKYGGRELVLSVEIKREGRKGLVVFTDNGAGFNPKMRENIFRAFERLESELPVGRHGTGMGLHISRQLARRMGGDLTADSPGKGRGSIFTLYLNIVS